MAFFDSIGKKVSEAGQKTLQKTKELSDTSRLSLLISEEEKRLNNTYLELGKQYFAFYKENYDKKFSALMGTISETEGKVADYRRQIREIKKVQRCEVCSADVAKGATFCSSCGSPIAKPSVEHFDAYMTCGNCHKPVKKGMQFCTECGSPIRIDLQESVPLAVEAVEEVAETKEVEEVTAEAHEENRFCPGCGVEVEDDMLFCMECGTKL